MWEDFPRLAALTGGGIALTLLDAGQTALGVMPESEDDDPTASDVETVVKFIREPGVTGLMNAHTVKFLESAHQAYEWDGNEEEVYCPKHKHLLNDD